MSAHTENFMTDKVVWVKDWWMNEFETIPADVKQQIVIDKRPKGHADLVKQNREESTLKFDIWQKRPEHIKTMQSTENEKNRIFHLHKYLLTVTVIPQTIE